MRGLLIVIAMVYHLGVCAQTTSNSSLPNSPDGHHDLTKITLDITSNLSSDSLKLLAIYKWITSNIVYDNAFRRRVEGDTTLTQEPYNVIKFKKAVCIGYSKLVRAMCQELDISCMVIEGFVKNSKGIIQQEEHAWNVVKINHNWYLLDATWGADAISALKYFLTPPSVFAENHLPHDPLWQLLEQPISLDCFVNDRDCYSKKDKIFNFRDTLKTFESLDSISKVLNEAIRTLNFNPKDIQAMRQLGEYYMFSALDFYKKYAQIRQAIRDKKQLPNNRQEALFWLENAEISLKKAKSEYARIIPYAKRNRYTDAQLNVELIDENLENIAQERDFVLKYFKD